MENALQHALKQAIKNNVPAWYDDEASTQATEPATTKETIMQTTQPATPPTSTDLPPARAYSGDKVKKIYELLVTYPNSSCNHLEDRLRKLGYEWFDSLSGQLKQLYDRGLVVRVKRGGEDGAERATYRYWPIANTLEEAVRAKKEAKRKEAKPPKTISFPINKEKDIKEKATQGLVPTQTPVQYAPVPQPERVMLRVGGFDAKQTVERMSVIEARAVYAELKAIFG